MSDLQQTTVRAVTMQTQFTRVYSLHFVSHLYRVTCTVLQLHHVTFRFLLFSSFFPDLLALFSIAKRSYVITAILSVCPSLSSTVSEHLNTIILYLLIKLSTLN